LTVERWKKKRKQNQIMKLKFLKTTPVGRNGVYHAGQSYEVKDEAAAELYIKHGYATAYSDASATLGGATKPTAAEPSPPIFEEVSKPE
jgi:hypothetical protein